MKKKYHYRALGVLKGDKRDGYYCTICGKQINTIHHYQFKHEEIYMKVLQMDQIRN